MITEREREALMRLTMCARIECDICIYKGDSIEKCDERITKNMNILADALRADRKTEPNSSEKPNNSTISKMEQVDEPERNMAEDIVESFGFKAKSYRQAKAKTEPQTCEECEHWNDTEDGCADRHGCKTEQTERSSE